MALDLPDLRCPRRLQSLPAARWAGTVPQLSGGQVTTRIDIEIEGHRPHTAMLPRDLTPQEKSRVMQALCWQLRFLQLWLEDVASPIEVRNPSDQEDDVRRY